MKYLIPSCLITMAAFSGPVLALVSTTQEPNAPVLVIGPPWVDVSSRVSDAGGRLIGPVSAPPAVLAMGHGDGFVDPLSGEPGLPRRGGGRLAEIRGVVLW